MVGGYNHNFRYKGRVFHVQTEDGGSKSPQIVTLLYEGGTILASCKSTYADLLGKEDHRQQVEQRMKAQHKEMLRRLRDGELDAKAGFATVSDAQPDAPSCSPSGASGILNQNQHVDVPAADVEPPEAGSLDELVFAYLAGNDPRYKKS
ncbi:MAG: hypothetical protein AB7D06_03020 [Pedobacter sp.]